jgi:hypothetical protein
VLQGIARNQDRLISLLAIDQVVGTDHVSTIAAAA